MIFIVASLKIVVTLFNSDIIVYTRFKILLDSKSTNIYNISKNINLAALI